MLKAVIKKKQDLFTLASLLVNRGLDAIILLVITPFLISKIGVDQYGVVIYYLSVVFFLQTIVSFGFENYLIYRGSLEGDHSKLLSTVLTIKFVIFIFLAMLYFIYVLFNYDGVMNFPYIFIILPLAEVINFSHYYVARGLSTKLVLFSVFRLLFFCFSVLYFVDGASDVDFYALALSFSYLLTVIIQLFYLMISCGVKISPLSLSIPDCKLCVSQSSSFFLLKLVQNTSDKVYILSAGIFITYSTVSGLDILFKIYAVFLMPAQLMITALLPRFIRREYFFNFKYLYYFMIFAAVFFTPIVYISSSSINQYFFGANESDGGGVLYLLVFLSAIFFIASFFISELYINPNGFLSFSVKISVAIVAVSSVALFSFGILGLLTLQVVLGVFLISKVIEFLCRVYFCHSLKLTS